MFESAYLIIAIGVGFLLLGWGLDYWRMEYRGRIDGGNDPIILGIIGALGIACGFVIFVAACIRYWFGGG